MTGAELIAKERERQITEEGWTAEHDNEHPNGNLAIAGACYALATFGYYASEAMNLWPWASEWWKPTPNDPIRQLIKAGALIAAEIDKLQRQTKICDLCGKPVGEGELNPHKECVDKESFLADRK